MDDINHTTIQNALATLKNLREDPPSSEELSSCRELLRETKSEPGKPIGYQYFRNPEYVEPDSISEKPNNNGILDGNLSTGRYASVPGQGEPGSNKTREDLGAASIRYPTIPTDDSEQADTEDAANSTLGSVGDAGGVSDSGGAAPLSASTPIASDDDATGSLASGNTPSRRSSSLARQSIEPIKEEDFAMVGLRTGTKPKAARKRLPLPASNSSSPQTQPAQSIKKGHRREYDFVWDHDGVLVYSWCNPICAKIRPLPIRERCTCGECPDQCSDCEGDSPYESDSD
uniref:Non-structural protein V n=1 Tax=Niviventer confucianus morbillivirus TaxID=3049976 RepID=A0A9Y1Z4Y7_9MONO|nr:V protein [Niviventer confucianus morbillivirus]